MKGIMNFLFASALFVALMAMTGANAWAQSAQKQLDPRLQTQMAELKAKMQKLEPNSNSYKVTKAEYDRLLSKESESQKAEAPKGKGPAVCETNELSVKPDGKKEAGNYNRVDNVKQTPTPTTRRDVNTVTTTKKVIKGTGNVTGSPLRSLNPPKH